MEDMTGRWAWRGSSRSEADDPARATLTGTVPGGTAEAGGSHDSRGLAGELDGAASDRPGGPNGCQGPAGGHADRPGEVQGGPGEAAGPAARDQPAPADQPLPRE